MLRSKLVTTVKATLRIAVCGVALLLLVAPHSSAQTDGDVVPADEVTTVPSLSSAQRTANLIQESYPSRLESRGIGGSVLLEFIIETDGTVSQASVKVVAATINGLGDAAKAVAHRIEFNPGEVDGRPVRTLIRFPIEYRAT